VAGSCEHSNETLGTKKDKGFPTAVQLCHVADSQIRIKPLIKHSLFATFPYYSSLMRQTWQLGGYTYIYK
jgi:hypothetical protein